ncbi:MAG: fibronectin type III domain-containing protein [Candidatus Marinimicrobia bacterium]|nr:fibronectin type III domain-containing protein [Candidatus Neomarinimicrobiota bacterium]
MKRSFYWFVFLVMTVFGGGSISAQDGLLAPPVNLQAADHPWDHGDKVDLTWNLSVDDPALVTSYRIYSSVSPDGPFSFITIISSGDQSFTVEKLERGDNYFFKLVAVGTDGSESLPAVTTEAVVPARQWFDGNRFSLAIIILIFCGSVYYWIRHARMGGELKIRKIAGLEAIEEAVGRATEMGRSCLFIVGIQDMNEIQTIAGITILSKVAKIAAELDAKIEVPTSRSLVMTAAREAVQASYLSMGRPDAYNQDLIYYVTDEQFGFVAHVQGMMVREKPAACFYMGAFFAESLILAETGNSIGAIQVAGTAMPAQLPFFVAACDYTLIGEEFFAASAYLSGEPAQLGSLKGQDVGKIIVGVGIIVGVLMSSVASMIGIDTPFGGWLYDAVNYLKEVILT